MNWKRTAGLAGLAGLLLTVPAHTQEDYSNRQASDANLLGGFDIIIGDTGDRYDGWSGSATRVFVEVDDGRRYHEHYFDNLPAMMFALRETYGRARITYLEVPEYGGPRHERHGHAGHGLIDGRYAWYVWDYSRYSRGGTPLVLAFRDYEDARREARNRDASVLSYEDMMWRLNDWADRAYERLYWRGWDRERWRDDMRWRRAWDTRWPGARWDDQGGWLGVELDLGDFSIRWESDRDTFNRSRFNNGDWYYYSNDGRYYYDDRDYLDRQVSDFVFDMLGLDEDSNRGHGNDRDGYDEGNPGKALEKMRERQRDQDKERAKEREKVREREREREKERGKERGKNRGKGKQGNQGKGKGGKR